MQSSLETNPITAKWGSCKHQENSNSYTLIDYQMRWEEEKDRVVRRKFYTCLSASIARAERPQPPTPTKWIHPLSLLLLFEEEEEEDSVLFRCRSSGKEEILSSFARVGMEKESPLFLVEGRERKREEGSDSWCFGRYAAAKYRALQAKRFRTCSSIFHAYTPSPSLSHAKV